ncbi:5-methylaminomethyl-2-thiouridylate-methyltransferase [Gaertneriomyces semiglobifer]|nr:5-methylaminomethyl-2-thiouridylate-methyltransferase [Gaertneriomyces semiglobifer]
MSGGVDSSVSALLLQRDGYHVEGVYMRNWDERDEKGICPSDQDFNDVQEVCRTLDIPCQKVDFSKEYWINVFEDFIAEVDAGRTPNPDVSCNREIKFGAFFEKYVGEDGKRADFIATGHYAQICRNGVTQLIRGVDRNKDQTYYLYNVSHRALQRTIFPIGHLLKSHVKRIAQEHGLHVARKAESMGICFVGKRKYGEFLGNYIEHKPGPFLTLDGAQKGIHKGIARYTLGQKARIPGESQKWYVAEKDIGRNALYIVPGINHPALYRSNVRVTKWSWIAGHEPADMLHSQMRVVVKYRYRGELVPCWLKSEDAEGCYSLCFDEPQWGLARGQHVVAYVGDACLGGGVIDQLGGCSESKLSTW